MDDDMEDDIIDYVAGDMSGTMTDHWLAGQFLNWASQLGHFFDPLSNQSPPNRPIKN